MENETKKNVVKVHSFHHVQLNLLFTFCQRFKDGIDLYFIDNSSDFRFFVFQYWYLAWQLIDRKTSWLFMYSNNVANMK